MSNEQLELLKRTLHPEKQMNIIDQCHIVADALAEGGAYYGNKEGLAIYLELSPSKVYQMERVWRDMIPDLKEWFRGTEYQCRTAYDVATLPVEAQGEYLRNQIILVTGIDPRHSLETTIIKENE